MSKHSHNKLVQPKTKPKDPIVKTLEESRQVEQIEEPILMELDNEIECPRCYEVMELSSSFDALAYFCESCSFVMTAHS